MTDHIKSDYALTKEAKSLAQEIFDTFKDDNGGANFDAEASRDDMNDRAYEYADQSEHVIYTSRAIAICGNCDTDDGEEWLEGMYGTPFDGCETFGEVCTRLAFATLYTAIQNELDTLIEAWEPAEEADEEQAADADA
jgi:hypothetical protein